MRAITHGFQLRELCVQPVFSGVKIWPDKVVAPRSLQRYCSKLHAHQKFLMLKDHGVLHSLHQQKSEKLRGRAVGGRLSRPWLEPPFYKPGMRSSQQDFASNLSFSNWFTAEALGVGYFKHLCVIFDYLLISCPAQDSPLCIIYVKVAMGQ